MNFRTFCPLLTAGAAALLCTPPVTARDKKPKPPFYTDPATGIVLRKVSCEQTGFGLGKSGQAYLKVENPTDKFYKSIEIDLICLARDRDKLADLHVYVGSLPAHTKTEVERSFSWSGDDNLGSIQLIGLVAQ